MMELQLDYDGITDGTAMAQASTLVPVTKMKKAQAWTLALSWDYYLISPKGSFFPINLMSSDVNVRH